MGAGSGLRVDRAGSAGDVLLLTLDRPDVRNAIDDALLGALLGAVEAAAAGDGDTRALVLTGAGGAAFSAGMDLRERAGFSDGQLADQHGRIVALMTALTELPIPSIAAVEGFCLAGGFELALACDLVVAARDAVFALPETHLGIFPGGGAARLLTWALGAPRARDLILTGRRLTGEEAAAWGLVARLCEPGEALAGAVALADDLARAAPLGLREAKHAMRAAVGSLRDGQAAEDAMYDIVVGSADRREGFRAFVEKRRPRFEGR
ncbi:MAG TPA: enoyl-CoA hydratase/isomerase family protein [Candidatus Limnocylindrales bacterium]